MSADEERASITTGTMREESSFWLGQASWRSLAGECAGSALLLALTCLCACAPAAPDPLRRALASGLVVTLLVQCFMHISGAQLNPSVTLAAVVVGRGRRAAAALEAAAQLAGALAGAALPPLLAPHAPADGYCVTRPRQGLSAYKAVCIEALLTLCLALANCASWDARGRLPDSWPLRAGLSVAALTLVAGELTGASMNPARSFASAAWSGDWADHWVYWAGPLSGAALAGALARAVWRPPRADTHHKMRR